MGFGSLLHGDPERKRREKQEKDQLRIQESKRLNQINKAYIEAKVNRRIENAKIKGIADADKMANQKPFYQKLMGAAATVGKDMIKQSSQTNTDVLFNFGETKKPRHRKKKR